MPQTISQYGDPENLSTLIEDPDKVPSDVLSFFFSYWRGSRGKAVLPLRSSFDPRHIRGHLQWVLMADRIAASGEFRYRVVGSRPAEYFLGHGTGKTIREAFAGVDEGFVARIEHLYRRACDARIPIQMTGPSSRYQNIFFPRYDALYLPYSSDGETADRIVNIFWFDRKQIMLTREPLLALAVSR